MQMHSEDGRIFKKEIANVVLYFSADIFFKIILKHLIVEVYSFLGTSVVGRGTRDMQLRNDCYATLIVNLRRLRREFFSFTNAFDAK